MDLNKAIRKQNKSYKRFMQLMSLIFFVLPIVLLLTKRFHIFYVAYLLVIELLVVIAVFIRISYEKLKFNISGYKLKINQGIFGKEISVACEKVALVHTEGKEEKLEIIVLCTSKNRKIRIKPVDSDFLQKYAFVAYNYYRMKKLQPENEYFYFIITKGGYYKYNLLYTIYKNCVNAFFTDNAIEKIKQYKN